MLTFPPQIKHSTTKDMHHWSQQQLLCKSVGFCEISIYVKLVLCEKKGRGGRKIQVVDFYPQAYGVMVFSFGEWNTFVRLYMLTV